MRAHLCLLKQDQRKVQPADNDSDVKYRHFKAEQTFASVIMA